MRVEVIYATPTEQQAVDVDVPPGATVRDAVQRSGLLERFREIDLDNAAVGVFGERAALDDPLEENDRVEIYRPLIADPKEARRRRARKKR